MYVPLRRLKVAILNWPIPLADSACSPLSNRKVGQINFENHRTKIRVPCLKFKTNLWRIKKVGTVKPHLTNTTNYHPKSDCTKNSGAPTARCMLPSQIGPL